MSNNTTVVSVPSQELSSRIRAFSDAISCEEELVRKILAELIELDKPDQALTILDSEDCLTFGDLAKHFVQPGFCKVAVLRLGMKHLRGQTELIQKTAEPSETLAGAGIAELAAAVSDMAKSNRPIENWTDKELLDQYDESNPKVIKELSARAHGRHCIVFKDNSETMVNADASLELLKLAKKQSTPDRWRINGVLVAVKRPGVFTPRALDESPFYSNVALVNNYCSQSDTDWTGVSTKNRILARIHVQLVEKTALSQRELKSICADARKESFEQDYASASLIYNELERQDKLPKMKVSSDRPSEKRDNGF